MSPNARLPDGTGASLPGIVVGEGLPVDVPIDVTVAGVDWLAGDGSDERGHVATIATPTTSRTPPTATRSRRGRWAVGDFAGSVPDVPGLGSS
jgi:hypothetical protein